ncbi:hypothetical protein C943_03731 [Mariniradius saccharolyticus AK6]|uniref:Uncharacterized protein n=1 Tax=Mariniradius saccharolyticus AK6 TaxID=1239962 RepID=M7Y1A4_9BACT|nr:hypothetical protein C943_03731 [Mariniradius saccharolyticus AK6]
MECSYGCEALGVLHGLSYFPLKKQKRDESAPFFLKFLFYPLRLPLREGRLQSLKVPSYLVLCTSYFVPPTLVLPT